MTSTARVSRSASADTMKQSGPATRSPAGRIVKANTATETNTRSGPRTAHFSSSSPSKIKLRTRSRTPNAAIRKATTFGSRPGAEAEKLTERQREGPGVANRGDAQQKQSACEIEG